MSSVPDALRAALGDRYRIERELGAGGMATVYLAEDLKHRRQVALKVLRPELSALLGAERFLKEIEVTANLQHPHLLPLFDSGAAAGLLYYVMPYVAGETLRERLKQDKQLGVDEAVRIASQVASALDYAHRQGVIHRDIKPENILLAEGQALVADFGIALALRQAGGERLTETGLSLGTPQYMSPEQATGERVLDARSDIYSLACVLYEMLVGEPPHTGPTMQAVIARVVAEEPRGISGQRKAVPWWLEEAVLKALEKLPADRFASAAEFGAALQTPAGPRTGPHARSAAKPRMAVLATAAIVMLGGGLAIGSLIARSTATDGGAATRVVQRATILLPDSAPLAFVGEAPQAVGRRALALSPDGQTLVYVGSYRGRTHLFVRPLDDERVRRLEGTEGAYGPFFSPNGRWVAFFSGHALKKVELDGGVPIEIATAPDVYGALWLPDGRIVFSANEHIPTVVGENGGASTVLNLPFNVLSWSAALDAEHVIVTGFVQSSLLSMSGEDAWMLSARGFERRRPDAPRYLEPEPGLQSSPQFLDHDVVLVADDGRLHAVPFEPGSLRPRGPVIPLDERMRQEAFGFSAQFTVGGNGTLVYAPGENVERSLLVVADRQGHLDTLPFARAGYWNPRYSRDGRRVAVTVRVSRGWELRVLDLEAGTRVVAYASRRQIYEPFWSTDGLHLQFYDDTATLEVRATGGAPTLLAKWASLTGRSADGRWTAWAPDTGSIYVEGPTRERSAFKYGGYAVDFSRDGKWIAGSGGSGSAGVEVFVSALPLGGPIFAVTPDGCTHPQWMPSGRALVCHSKDGYVYEVPLVFERGEVRGGTPRRITKVPSLETMGTSYALSPDGARVLFVATPPSDTTTRLTVVTNFRRVVDEKLAAAQGRARP